MKTQKQAQKNRKEAKPSPPPNTHLDKPTRIPTTLLTTILLLSLACGDTSTISVPKNLSSTETSSKDGALHPKLGCGRRRCLL